MTVPFEVTQTHRIRRIGEEEAVRFNKYWVAGTGTWVLGAVMAHLLAWSWRPWF